MANPRVNVSREMARARAEARKAKCKNVTVTRMTPEQLASFDKKKIVQATRVELQDRLDARASLDEPTAVPRVEVDRQVRLFDE